MMSTFCPSEMISNQEGRDKMLKRNMWKTAVAVLISSVVLMMLPMTSMAETTIDFVEIQQETEISPRMTYIVDAESTLSINGTTATVDCWVKGKYGDATKAKVIAELQVKNGDNWIPVAIWTDTQNDFTASVYETHSVVTGHTYRVKGTFYVWEGSQSEELILTTDEKTA